MGIESNILVAAQIPSPVLIQCVVALAGSHLEAQQGVSHQLRLRALGPDLSEAAPPLTADYTVTPGPNAQPGWEVRTVLAIGVQLEVMVPGTYSIEIATDGGAPMSVPVVVAQQ